MYKGVKRALDVTFSLIGTAVSSPILLAVAAAVKLDSKGPVIFKQERLGKDGKVFEMYKFRSMRVNVQQETGWSTDCDPRKTHFGSFIRKFSLDELPQLWNVFVGDMSFIGPRPERKFYIDQIIEHDPRYINLYQIRPGVTSYATLHNGYTDTMEKMLRRLELDLYYLEHRSWLFDCKILAETFFSIAFGKKF